MNRIQKKGAEVIRLNKGDPPQYIKTPKYIVLYESVVPPVYPITEAIIIIAIYTIFSIFYGFYLKKKKPDIAWNAGKSVNIVAEEELEVKANSSK